MADANGVTGAGPGTGTGKVDGAKVDGEKASGAEGSSKEGARAGMREGAQRTLTALATGLHQKMRACSGEVSLELLILLSEGERSVGMLARMLLLDLPSVSGRLSGMKENGLVVLVRKEGNRRIYALSSLVRVSERAERRVIRLKASEGGELKIVLGREMVERIAAGWAELERAEREEGTPGVLVRQVTVREIAARVGKRK